MMRFAPHVSAAMMEAAFWLERAPDPDAPLLGPEQIAAFNARVYEVLGIPPVLDLPDSLPRAEVEALMRAYLPTATRYNAEGQPIEPEVFERALTRLSEGLPEQIAVHFGIATRRVSVRAFPTLGVITARPYEYALDRLQETTIDPGSPVAMVVITPDERWTFGLTPLYWGWIPLEAVVPVRREDAASWVTAEPFVVSTASRSGLVTVGTGQPLDVQMGTRLPLAGETPDILRVVVPSSAEPDGEWRVHANGRREDFAVGCLPLTIRTLLTQAFKLLGEPYAWGGSRMGIFGRDCSRFIQDVYATAGVYLPRNGDQQGRVGRATVEFREDMDDSTRQARLVEQVLPGAILELPGHVMLYVGHVDGRPYAIHDTSSGEFSEVIVSDLSLGAERSAGTLLRRLSRAVEVA